MPTILAHAVAATAIGEVSRPRRVPARFWVVTAICAMLPDIDVLTAFLFNVPYRAPFGHRGFTHSVVFAAMAGFLAAGWYKWSDEEAPAHSPKLPWNLARLWLYFFLVTLSHPLLDALTDGGMGVAVWAPFSNTRYFFPWRPIAVSPIGTGFFSPRGVAVLVNELWWIGVPALAVNLATRWWRKR